MIELEEAVVVSQEAVEDGVLRFETRVGEMTYDRASYMVCSPLAQGPVNLTPNEAILFEKLMTKPEGTLTYKELAMLMWGIAQPNKTEAHAINMCVTRLRAKLGDIMPGSDNKNHTQLIHTVLNVGYSLTDSSLGWEQFKSDKVVICNTSAGQFRFRLPEMTVLSPLLEFEVQLTPVEWDLFARLIGQAGQIISFSTLLKEGWNINDVDPVDEHLLRINILRLRRKLGEQKHGKYKLIHNYKEIGYSLGYVH